MRKVRDSNLETRTSRARLRARYKPYLRRIESGLALGYRKLPSGPGTWLARRYTGDGRYALVNLRTADGALVIADDFVDADGARVLNFAQAQQSVRAIRPAQRTAETYTVNDCLDDYLEHLQNDGRSAHTLYDIRNRIETHIRPILGQLKTALLTTAALQGWLHAAAKAPARIRTGKGLRQRHRVIAGEDGQRARRATANKSWNVVRAALNHGFRNGKIASDVAWRRVKPFKAVDSARMRFLTVVEARRLINASDPELRILVRAALASGCRYGELIRLEAGDFDPDSGTLAIRRSKSGRSRHVVLTDEGQALFAELTAGRSSGDPMFTKRWGASMQARPMRQACHRAKIVPAIGFHQLRHTYASLSVQAGVPLVIVARILGHRDTRMCERHYAHLARDFVTDAVRRGAPTFGYMSNPKLATLSSRR